MTKLIPIMSNLEIYYNFKLAFLIVGQHTGGKWVIHSTKHCTDSQLQFEMNPKKNDLTTFNNFPTNFQPISNLSVENCCWEYYLNINCKYWQLGVKNFQKTVKNRVSISLKLVESSQQIKVGLKCASMALKIDWELDFK